MFGKKRTLAKSLLTFFTIFNLVFSLTLPLTTFASGFEEVEKESIKSFDWQKDIRKDANDKSYKANRKKIFSKVYEFESEKQSLKGLIDKNSWTVNSLDENLNWELKYTLDNLNRESDYYFFDQNNYEVKKDGNFIEIDKDVLTEWYQNDENGIEQGFTIYKKLSGEGNLNLEAKLDTDLNVLKYSDDKLLFFDENKEVLQISDLKVYDAENNILDSYFDFDKEKNILTISVDDSEAVYPIVVDPLAKTASWSVEGVDIPGLNFGNISFSGDFNGDGYDDVAISDNQYTLYFYFGSESGLNNNYDTSLTVPSSKIESFDYEYSYSRNSLISSGDLNNDGYDDIILLGRGQDKVFVIYSSAGGFSGEPILMINTFELSSMTNYVKIVDDLNNDGYRDIIVAEHNPGKMAVYYSSSTLDGFLDLEDYDETTTTADILVDLPGTFNSRAIFDIETADFNNDTFNDLIIGQPFYQNDGDVYGDGRILIYYGSSTGLNSTAGWSKEGDNEFGNQIAVSDFNNDGYDDFFTHGLGYFDNGAVYLFDPALNNFDEPFFSDIQFPYFNSRLSDLNLSDINNDGYDDLIIGYGNHVWNSELEDSEEFNFFDIYYYNTSTGFSNTFDWEYKWQFDETVDSFMANRFFFSLDTNNDGNKELFASVSSYNAEEGIVYLFSNTTNTYSLNYSAGSGGSVIGEASQTVYETYDGTEVTAIPDYGYEFTSWSDGSTENPRTDTNVTSSVDVMANFTELATYTLTYSTGTIGGYISGISTQNVYEGYDGTTVTAISYFGYEFTSWSDGSTENPRTDTAVTSSIDVSATFTEFPIYTLNYSTGTIGGYISGTSTQSVYEGYDGTTVTATPSYGYHFVDWSDGVTTSARTDTNVDSNINVTANFATSTFIILSYTAGEGGFISGDASQTVSFGDNGTVVAAVPYTGYEFVDWSDGRTDNPRLDLGVIEDMIVTANFSILPAYTLNFYTSGPNGYISGSSTQIIYQGGNSSIVEALPYSAYYFGYWVGEPTPGVVYDNPLIVTNVTSSANYVAYLFPRTFVLNYTVCAGGGGSISGNQLQTMIPYGGSGTEVTAVPEVGYSFFGWWNANAGGYYDSYQNPRTDTNVTASKSVCAFFSPQTAYTLNYYAGDNGSLTGSTTQQIMAGEDGIEVTAVPNEHYVFSSWSDSSTQNPRTDTNVQGAGDFYAYFNPETFLLTYRAGENGQVARLKKGGDISEIGDIIEVDVEYAGTSEITAFPDPGYSFVSWSDGVLDNPRVDNSVSSTLDVTASFTEIVFGGSAGTFDLSINKNKKEQVSNYYFTLTTNANIPDGGKINILFPDGFGLTYASTEIQPLLPVGDNLLLSESFSTIENMASTSILDASDALMGFYTLPEDNTAWQNLATNTWYYAVFTDDPINNLSEIQNYLLMDWQGHNSDYSLRNRSSVYILGSSELHYLTLSKIDNLQPYTTYTLFFWASDDSDSGMNWLNISIADEDFNIFDISSQSWTKDEPVSSTLRETVSLDAYRDTSSITSDGDWNQYAITFTTADNTSIYPIFRSINSAIDSWSDWYLDDFYLAEGEYPYITENVFVGGDGLSLEVFNGSVPSGTTINFTINNIINPSLAQTYNDFLIYMSSGENIIDGPWDLSSGIEIEDIASSTMEISLDSSLPTMTASYTFGVTTTDSFSLDPTKTSYIRINFPFDFDISNATVDIQNLIAPSANLLTDNNFKSIEGLTSGDVLDASNAFVGAYMYSMGMPAGSLDLWQSLATNTWQYIQMPGGEVTLLDPSAYLVSSTYGYNSGSSLWSHRGCVTEDEFEECIETQDYFFVSKIDNLQTFTTYTMYFWADIDLTEGSLMILGADEDVQVFESATNSWVPFSIPDKGEPPYIKIIDSASDYYLAKEGNWKQYAFTFRTDAQTAFYPVLITTGNPDQGEFNNWYFDDFYLAEGGYINTTGETSIGKGGGNDLAVVISGQGVEAGTKLNLTIDGIINPEEIGIYEDVSFLIQEVFEFGFDTYYSFLDGIWSGDVEITDYPNVGVIEINPDSSLIGARASYNFGVTTTAKIPVGTEILLSFPIGYDIRSATVDYQNLITPSANILTPEKFYNIENTSPAEVTDVSAAFSGAFGGNLTGWQSLTTSTWQYIQFSEDPLANPSDYLVTSTYGNSSSSYSLWSHRGCISEEFPGSGNCTESHDYIYVSKIDNLTPNTTYTMYFWADMDFASNTDAGVLILGLDENFNLFDASVNSWVPFFMPEKGAPPFVKMINSDSGYLAESGDWRQYAFTFKTDDQTAFYPVLAFMNGPDEVGEFYDWYFDDFYLAEGSYSYISDQIASDGEQIIGLGGVLGQDIDEGTKINFSIDNIFNPSEAGQYSEFAIYMYNEGSGWVDGFWRSDFEISNYPTVGEIEINSNSVLFGERTDYNFSVTTTEDIVAGSSLSLSVPTGFDISSVSTTYQNLTTLGANLLTSSTFSSIEGTETLEDCTVAVVNLMRFGDPTDWQALDINKWYYYYDNSRNSDPSDYLVTSTLGYNSSSSLWNHKGVIGENDYNYTNIGKIGDLDFYTTYTLYFWLYSEDFELAIDGYGLYISLFDGTFQYFDPNLSSWVQSDENTEQREMIIKSIDNSTFYYNTLGNWRKYAITFRTDEQTYVYPALTNQFNTDVGFADLYFDDFYLVEGGAVPYLTDSISTSTSEIILTVGDTNIASGTKINFTINSITNPLTAGLYSEFAMYMYDRDGFLDGFWRSDFEIEGLTSYTLTYIADPSQGSIIGPNPQSVADGGKGEEVYAQPNFGYVFIDWSDSSTQNPRQDLEVAGDLELTANFALVDFENPIASADLSVGSDMINETTDYTFSFTTTQDIVGARELNIVFPAGFDLTSASVIDKQNINTSTDSEVLTVEQFKTIEGILATQIASGTMAINNIFEASDLTGWQNLATSTWFFASINPDSVDPQLVGILTSGGFKGHDSDFALKNHREDLEGDLWYDYFHFAKIDDLDKNSFYTFSFWLDAEYTLGNEELRLSFLDENFDAFDPNSNSWIEFVGDFASYFINSSTPFDEEDGTWRKYSVTFSTDNQTVFYPVLVLDAYDNDINTDWYFDDFSVVKNEQAINLDSEGFVVDGQTISLALENNNISSGTEINFTINDIVNPSSVGNYLDFALYFLAGNGTLGDGPWSASLEIFEDVVVPETYTLNYTAGWGGSLAGETEQIVNEGGDGSTVTALALEGFDFVDWSDGVTTSARTDINITRDITVTANFATTTFVLSYSAGENGILTAFSSSTQIVNYGENGTEVTAIADEGYHFVAWSDGVSTSARTDTNVVADITVTANFELDEVIPETYTLTYIPGDNGGINGTKTQTVAEGEDGTEVIAFADEGYHFVDWSDGVTTSARTDINITRDITVTANFATTTFVLSYSAGENGILTAFSSSTQIVNYGEDGTEVTAIADEGYYFVDWSDGVTTASRTDLNVLENKTITANFAINTYTLTYSAGANGSVTGTLEQIINYGENGIEVTAIADEGYHFIDWSDGVTTSSRTDLDVTDDISVTANFAIDTYTLSYSAGENGVISAFSSSTQVVNYNEGGTEVEAVADEGYHFVRWSDDETANPRTDLEVTEDLTVSAIFAETFDEYLVTYEADANGSITGSSTQWVGHGLDATTVTATPNIGYSFVDWSDGVTSSSRTDINILETMTVMANFAINSYTLNYVAGSNGTLSGQTTQTVNYGANGTAVTAVANSGYSFSSWSDGSTSNPRTHIGVTQNISVTANFSRITGGGGGGSVGPTTPTVFDITFDKFNITEKDCQLIINIDSSKVERIAISDTINFANVAWKFYTKDFVYNLEEYADEIFIKLRSTGDLSSETFNYKIKNECKYPEVIIEDEADEDIEDVNNEENINFTPSYGLGICSEKYINTTLTVGSQSPEVKALQVFLNSVGFKIAETGVGSTGRETEYFGTLTLEALNRYRELCQSVKNPVATVDLSREKDARGCLILKAGDLYKVNESNSVYYLNSELKSMYFPTDEVFFSWGLNFANVITIPNTCFDNYEQATPAGLNFRPGSRLIKRTESPTVYAILPGNIRSAIASEEVAKALYGANWAGLVRDLPSVFMSNFLKTGSKIETTVPHDGQFIKEIGSITVYYVLNNKLYEVVDSVVSDVREVTSLVFNSLPKSGTTITLLSILKSI